MQKVLAIKRMEQREKYFYYAAFASSITDKADFSWLWLEFITITGAMWINDWFLHQMTLQDPFEHTQTHTEAKEAQRFFVVLAKFKPQDWC